LRNDNQWKTTIKSCYDLSFIIRHDTLIISTNFIINVWRMTANSSHRIFFLIRISSKSLNCYTFATSSFYFIKLFIFNHDCITFILHTVQNRQIFTVALTFECYVAEVHSHVFVVYKIQINFFVYKRSIRFQIHMKDASRRICKSVENALIHYLEEQSWTQQSEMIWFLWEKWSIYVHRFTVSRLLKRREWNNKSARRIDSQSEYLRQHWIADLWI
jgi:hypothetical protein